MRLNLAQTCGGTRGSFGTFAGRPRRVRGLYAVGGLIWLASALVCVSACKDKDSGGHAGAGAAGVAGAAAGSGSTAAGSGAGGAGGMATQAQCTRAAGLDGPDAPRGSCSSKRALVSCNLSGGATATCLSDDPTSCGEDVSSNATGCKNECTANEYAIVCGGIGPNIGNAAPPQGCHSLGQTPGGPAFYCCPCGS
jgi:hypothetical protein